MDNNIAIVLVVALVALVAVGFLLVFRRRGKMKLQGPFQTRVEMEGSNEPAPPVPGVRAKGVTSEEGKITARDKTSRGVDAEDLRAKKDIDLSNEPPPREQSPKE